MNLIKLVSLIAVVLLATACGTAQDPEPPSEVRLLDLRMQKLKHEIHDLTPLAESASEQLSACRSLICAGEVAVCFVAATYAMEQQLRRIATRARFAEDTVLSSWRDPACTETLQTLRIRISDELRLYPKVPSRIRAGDDGALGTFAGRQALTLAAILDVQEQCLSSAN
jgi:hypothetical protein